MRYETQRLPELFLERLRSVIPSSKWNQVANTFSESKPTTFRVNTLKTSAEDVRNFLQDQNFKVSWFPEAFILQQDRQRDLEKTEAYLNGEIYIQNLSSMIPPLVLDPKPGENILDLTAAPGGKTTQMACLMKGEGRIVANESDRIRFEKLKANVAMQNARNVEVVLSYGESFGNKHPEQFDRVLVDVPCSAEGRFLTSEPQSYRYWNLDKIKEIAKLQKKLLNSGLKALKAGGVLVYSTCTFSPEENEDVIDAVLQIYQQTVELEPINLKLHNQMPGLARFSGRQFNPHLKKAIRILPTTEMEGFFVAKLRKKGN